VALRPVTLKLTTTAHRVAAITNVDIALPLGSGV
jgi:hypothetical protein